MLELEGTKIVEIYPGVFEIVGLSNEEAELLYKVWKAHN